MLVVAYDPLLVTASMLVAVMACFTGLRLANGLSALSPEQRKSRITAAAIALGGGIWATHFVAMLALHLPVQIYYDHVWTLVSALVAVLATGAALIVLHFGERSEARIHIAGATMALGIVSMHYIGMGALRGQCVVSYGGLGVAAASLIALALCVTALRLAYRVRTLSTISAGALGLAAAVCAMHYTAMLGASFEKVNDEILALPALSNRELALFVAIAVFAICGGFLLTALPLLIDPRSRFSVAGGPSMGAPAMAPQLAGLAGASFEPAPERREQAPDPPPDPPPEPDFPGRRIPYQSGGATMFADPSALRAVKAQGHYCVLYAEDDQHFCPLSMSRLAEILEGRGFVRSHRSYLVNPIHVIGFERRKDQAVCFVECADSRHEVPVSRQKTAEMARRLGL